MRRAFAIAGVAFLILALALPLFSVLNDYQSLKERAQVQETAYLQQIALLESEVDEHKERASFLLSTVQTLQTQQEQCSEELISNSARAEVLKTEIDRFEQTLSSKIDWLNANANLGKIDHPQINSARVQLRSQCMRVNANSCTIKTSCLFLVNEYELGLRYYPDAFTSGNEDEFQDITSFVNNGGGDCEDYSRFFSAEFNYLVDACPHEDVHVEAYTLNPSAGRYDFTFDYSSNWFVEKGISAHALGVRNKIATVCGTMYIPASHAIGGHCVVAFYDEMITLDNLLEVLDGSPMVEPQQGNYIGVVGRDVPVAPVQGANGLQIWLVVTDDDLFMYRDGVWESYGAFLDRISSLS